MSSYILIISFLFFTLSSLIFRRRGYRILVNQMDNIINEKMIFQTQKNNAIKNDSNKSSKHKHKENKETTNFPPKKLHKDKTNIISVNNNSSMKQISNFEIKLALNEDNDKIPKIKRKKSLSKKFKNKKMSIKKKFSTLSKKLDTNENTDSYDFHDCEMNSFNYFEAVSYDKRTCCEYYMSLIKAKQPILFAFCPNDDYNSRLIKIGIFVLSFNIHYATNFVYFLNEKIIHKIFEDKGKYDIMFFLPYIAIAFIISHFITIIIKLIFLSDSNIIELKKHKNIMEAKDAISTIRRNLTIKYIIFFLLGIAFHLIFWFSLSSFSNMYRNTQVFVLENALIAFGISCIYPIIFNILPSIFRVCSLSGDEKNHNIIYSISKFLQMI